MLSKRIFITIFILLSKIITAYEFENAGFVIEMLHYLLKNSEKNRLSIVTVHNDEEMSLPSADLINEICLEFYTDVVSVTDLIDTNDNEKLIKNFVREDSFRIVLVDGYHDSSIIGEQLEIFAKIMNDNKIDNDRRYPRSLVILNGDGYDRNTNEIVDRIRKIDYLRDETLELLHLKYKIDEPINFDFFDFLYPDPIVYNNLLNNNEEKYIEEEEIMKNNITKYRKSEL